MRLLDDSALSYAVRIAWLSLETLDKMAEQCTLAGGLQVASCSFQDETGEAAMAPLDASQTSDEGEPAYYTCKWKCVLLRAIAPRQPAVCGLCCTMERQSIDCNVGGCGIQPSCMGFFVSIDSLYRPFFSNNYAISVGYAFTLLYIKNIIILYCIIIMPFQHEYY